MIASAEDARLLFDKWIQEEARVRIRMLRGALLFDGAGLVFHCSRHAVQVGGETWKMTVPLLHAEYAFSDPREIPMASVREVEAARYELGLSIRWPNGEEMVIMEMKTTAATEPEG